MTTFVTHLDAFGQRVEVGLPPGLALLDRGYAGSIHIGVMRYQLRQARNEPPSTAEGWISHDTIHLHGWKTEPTVGRLWLALRRDFIPDAIMSAEDIDRWARERGIESDVDWYRRRRTPIKPAKSLNDAALAEAIATLSREASERAAKGDDRGRGWDPIVNGRLLSSFTADELDHLVVATDWHRAGRPPIGGAK